MEPSLRLSAVLFADAAQYTRLVFENEADALGHIGKCLGVFSEVSAKHNGTLIKTTGDGAVIEFPSAVAGVSCAVALQKILSKLNGDLPEQQRAFFRIGIHLGEVAHEGNDIYGNSVNIAARLQSIAPPGGICISKIVYEQVRSRLKLGFECLGEQPLKNIDEPLVVYRVHEDYSASVLIAAPRPKSANLRMPARPSIVVLPFDVMAAEADAHAYIGDGITADIIANLSKFEELFVISRNSSFVYKNKKVNIGEISRTLGVQYVVEGDVRISHGNIRVSAELIDAASDRHIWAEAYNRTSENVFSVVGEITSIIVSTLVKHIELAEARRENRLDTTEMQAYRLYLQGQEALLKHNAQDNAAARKLFTLATEFDPKYARAFAGIARTYNYEWQFGWGKNPQAALDEALTVAKRAVQLDRKSAHGHSELGFTLLYKRRPENAIEEFRIARQANPNDPDIISLLATALTHGGRPAEAESLLEQAMRLNPFYPDVYLWYMADAKFSLRKYEEVILAVDAMTNSSFGARLAAASNGYLGKTAEAERWAKEVLRLDPSFSAIRAANKNPDNPEETEHFAEGLRKAGLPD